MLGTKERVATLERNYATPEVGKGLPKALQSVRSSPAVAREPLPWSTWYCQKWTPEIRNIQTNDKRHDG